MAQGGIIFDFNGTLFWDSEYQESSWDEYLENHNIKLTKSQKKEYIHGRNGKDTFEILFKRKLTDEEVAGFTEEKEVLYRKECLKHPMELAPGAIKLIDQIKSQDIPIAIATASGKNNVDFFIDKFGLLDFFEEEHIIYDDGTMRGKPHPDLFERAMERLDIEGSKSIIFEDSHSGIQAAINSRAHSVIIVNSTGDNYADFNCPEIRHFDEFDRALLEVVK